jgi:hypothetical protein
LKAVLEALRGIYGYISRNYLLIASRISRVKLI